MNGTGLEQVDIVDQVITVDGKYNYAISTQHENVIGREGGRKGVRYGGRERGRERGRAGGRK